MAAAITDEDLLLAVLNSAPVTDGGPTDRLEGPAGDEFRKRFEGTGTDAERRHLQRTRDALQAAIRNRKGAVELLAESLGRAALLPTITDRGIDWRLDSPADQRLSARTVLAWSRVTEKLPGRLRACANSECNLFLVDHSRPGTAKWCSMATCGNRMKARGHARRGRNT